MNITRLHGHLALVIDGVCYANKVSRERAKISYDATLPEKSVK